MRTSNLTFNVTTKRVFRKIRDKIFLREMLYGHAEAMNDNKSCITLSREEKEREVEKNVQKLRMKMIYDEP